MPPVGYSRNLKRSCVTNRLQRKRDQLWGSQPLQQRLSTLWPPCCEEAHSNTEDTTGRKVRCPGISKCSPMSSDARCVKAVFMVGQLLASKTEIFHLITIHTSTCDTLRNDSAVSIWLTEPWETIALNHCILCLVTWQHTYLSSYHHSLAVCL